MLPSQRVSCFNRILQLSEYAVRNYGKGWQSVVCDKSAFVSNEVERILGPDNVAGDEKQVFLEERRRSE